MNHHPIVFKNTMRASLQLLVLLLLFTPRLVAEEFPIVATDRKAITGDGYVITMKNTSDSSFRITFSALGKTVQKVVDASATWELGHAEGFTLAVGDKYTMTVGEKTVERVILEKKIPPISPTFRKALLGSSLVLVVQRNKDSVKGIQVVAVRPTTGEKKIFTNSAWVTVTYEIGHLEGWAFQKGDKVTITGEGIEKIELTVE
jgi:hypothetical protein